MYPYSVKDEQTRLELERRERLFQIVYDEAFKRGLAEGFMIGVILVGVVVLAAKFVAIAL